MNPFSKTAYVSFELSNICPYSIQHKACPLSTRSPKSKDVLPFKTVDAVLKDLKLSGFRGMIGWNIYNEPLCDPRLYLLVLEARGILGDQLQKQFVLTNGFYLNQVVLEELHEIGVGWVRVTCYSKEEKQRISALKAPDTLKWEVIDGALDARAGFYDKAPEPCRKPCLAPLHEICIYSDGNVALCCLDFERRHTFGNVNTEKLSDIVNKGEMGRIREQLERGERNLHLCQRCGYSR